MVRGIPLEVLAEDNIPQKQIEVIQVHTPVKTYLNCSEFRPLLEKYDWDVDLMMRIMELESHCNPEAVGDKHLVFDNGMGMSCGLMQVRVLEGRPDCESLKNPEFNIEWAYKIYQTQGYYAWSVVKKFDLV